VNYLNDRDIIAVTETKLRNGDVIEFDGFTFFHVNREHAKHASGGVELFVRDNLSSFVQQLHTTSDFCLMIEINDELCGQNVLLRVVYIPPESSPYSSIELFDELENHILDSAPFCKGAALCMLGDINSRTGQLCDILEIDKTIDNLCTDQDMFECGSRTVSELENVGTDRSSRDVHINNYGYRLISLCKNLGVVIANGRIGDDKGIGKTTCDGKRVVDYNYALLTKSS
jgi:hypothetical protein